MNVFEAHLHRENLIRRAKAMISRRIARRQVASQGEITAALLARHGGRCGEELVRAAVHEAFATYRAGPYRGPARSRTGDGFEPRCTRFGCRAVALPGGLCERHAAVEGDHPYGPARVMDGRPRA